ncbi:MAG: hypothetical protein Q9213_003413 [Squamulea squamosa]
MSSSPTTTSTSDYDNLISLLHPTPHQILEIEILRTSHSSSLLSTPPSIGIPQKVLLACFLHARKLFLSYTTATPLSCGQKPDHIQAVNATRVLTLWEPNWSTAWTFRKRALLEIHHDDGMQDGEEGGKRRFREFVEEEMEWVETLVTSPLDGKHAKSSWVWAHRLWVVRMFFEEMVAGGSKLKEIFGKVQGQDIRCFVKRELKIVMVAGERHARNYYAWEYARQIWRMCMETADIKSAREPQVGVTGEEGMVYRPSDGKLWGDCTRMIHQWCLMHPRDISGWAFLVFMLDWKDVFRDTRGEDESTDTNLITREDIFQKTREFVQRFNWKGESVEWFLKSASHFQHDSND